MKLYYCPGCDVIVKEDETYMEWFFSQALPVHTTCNNIVLYEGEDNGEEKAQDVQSVSDYN